MGVNASNPATRPRRRPGAARGDRVQRVDADRGDQRRDHQEAHDRRDDRLRERRRAVVGARELLQPDARHDQLGGHDHRAPSERRRAPEVAEVDDERVAQQRAHVARRPSSSSITQRAAGQLPVGLGDARDGLLDLVRRHGGVGDPKRALAALDQEVGALDEDHAALARRRAASARDVACPRAGRPRGSSRPAGSTKRGVGEVRARAPRRSRRGARAARAFTVSIERVDRARVAELGHDRLGDHVRRDVGARWPACGSRRSGPPGRPGSRRGCRGRPSSRTRTRRPRVPRLVEREHRRERLALEAQLHVGVVLEDREAVLARRARAAAGASRATACSRPGSGSWG